MTLPLSLDEITPDWLTGALGKAFPGVKVAAVRRDLERAGTSTSARFTLTYAERGAGDPPAAIYIKGGFDPVMRRRVWAALLQEAQFYADLAGDAPLNLPRAYFTAYESEGERQGIVIIEDLTRRGVRFGHATDKATADDAARILSELAKMHARFWDQPRLAPYVSWADPQRTYLRYLFRPKHWDLVHTRAYADLLAQVVPSPEAGVAALERMWALNDAQPRTLVHGDCHSGNLYHEADGRPGFLDWQCVFAGFVAHDIAELFCTTLDIDVRRAHERALLAHYRGELLAHGAPAPSADALFLFYRRNIMHNVASSGFNPYDMQTQEVTDLNAMRSLQAAADLDTMGALR